MIYKRDDIIDTKTYGILTVVAPITYKVNTNPKYDKLGGKTIYWLKDMNNAAVLLWDDELAKDLTYEDTFDISEDSDKLLIED